MKERLNDFGGQKILGTAVKNSRQSVQVFDIIMGRVLSAFDFTNKSGRQVELISKLYLRNSFRQALFPDLAMTYKSILDFISFFAKAKLTDLACLGNLLWESISYRRVIQSWNRGQKEFATGDRTIAPNQSL